MNRIERMAFGGLLAGVLAIGAATVAHGSGDGDAALAERWLAAYVHPDEHNPHLPVWYPREPGAVPGPHR